MFVRFVNIDVSIDAVVLLAVRATFTAGRRVNSTHFVWRVVTSKTYEELPMHFTSWATAQRNYKGHICMLLNREHNYNWDDYHCAGRFGAVCEIDIA